MTALDRMIAAQPTALRTVADIDVGAVAARVRGARRIVLIGTGTSLHAAQLGAFALDSGGTPAHAVDAAGFVGARTPLGPGEAAVLITHTGQTAFARAARARLLAAGAPFCAITGPDVDWPEAIRTPVADAAETYTVSYTATLGVLGLVAHALTGSDTGPAALRRVAARVDAVLSGPAVDDVAFPARALAVVGGGPWAVTAQEVALKLREGARLLCEGFSAERLLHGAAVPYGAADGLLALAPDRDPTGLVAAVAAAAATEGVPVHVIAGEDPDEDPLLAQIPLTVRLHALTARMAALRGTDPDVAIVGGWAAEQIWELGAP